MCDRSRCFTTPFNAKTNKTYSHGLVRGRTSDSVFQKLLRGVRSLSVQLRSFGSQLTEVHDFVLLREPHAQQHAV